MKPYDGPFDFEAAAHLWRRAGFGATPSRIAETQKLGAAEAAGRIVCHHADDAPAEELETVYAQVLGTGNVDAIRAWFLQRMVRCDHQLREKLALFWHGHFATSVLKVNEPAWMARQYRLLLDKGLGPFADLLHDVTRDPAMIRWLDNETNSKGHPNENYARELFELFTLGEGNYTEKDIKEAARAFTGWHILEDRYHFSQRLHDCDLKEVLGVRGPLGGDDVCKIALEQPACARFLARKLLQYFVKPEPSKDEVEAFAEVLRGRRYQMGPCLEVLFSSQLFHESRGLLVKSPIEFVATAVRVSGGKLDATAAQGDLRAMGQDLLAPPNVKGWPGHLSWINTATWLSRVDAARRLSFPARGDEVVAALCGRAPGAEERERLAGAGNDFAHALLCLPEAHLS